MSLTLINSPAALRRACDELGAAIQTDPRIALDTEFVGEQTYESQLMLIQLAAPDGQIALIDPQLLRGKLGPVAELLNTPGLLKIMHAGGQDVPILLNALGPISGPWFDTQIAAAYVGYPLQVGYVRLIEAEVGARLAKDESLSDWGRRPIPESMLAYAADDVRYLHAAHAKLAEKLARMGRAAWVDEAAEDMVRGLSEKVAPEDLWRKMARGTGLDGKGLAVLRALCIWRDDEASRRDRPRRSVMRDETLIELSRRAPKTVDAVMNLRSIPNGFGEHRAAELVERIEEALAIPPAERPVMDTNSVELDDHGKALNELLSAVLRIRAIEADIAPALIATADTLRRLAASSRVDDVARVFAGWRDALIGNDFRAALAGELSVAWDPELGRMVCKRADGPEPGR